MKQALRLIRPGPAADEAAIAIDVRALHKVFRKRDSNASGLLRKKSEFVALNNISFHVKRGEIYGILGVNGSGKSTLIRAISTLLIPDSGTVSIFGLDVVRDEAHVRRLINRVSVDAAFYKSLSARENLMYSARLYGLDPYEAEERSLQILKRLGLRAKSYYERLEEMSRGMQQKVAIARAFLASPIVILLDEPTTGLDPKSRLDVQEFVLELRQQHDATIILTTHDMPEADRLCDRMAFMHSGAFVAEGTGAELKALCGPQATLEEAFLKFTGDKLDDR